MNFFRYGRDKKDKLGIYKYLLLNLNSKLSYIINNIYLVIYVILFNYNKLFIIIEIFYFYKLWGLGIGDWGLGIGDWAQSPKPKPPTPKKIIFY